MLGHRHWGLHRTVGLCWGVEKDGRDLWLPIGCCIEQADCWLVNRLLGSALSWQPRELTQNVNTSQAMCLRNKSFLWVCDLQCSREIGRYDVMEGLSVSTQGLTNFNIEIKTKKIWSNITHPFQESDTLKHIRTTRNKRTRKNIPDAQGKIKNKNKKKTTNRQKT